MGDTRKALDEAIARGQEQGKASLYFGCWERPGHYLHTPNGETVRNARRDFPGFCWDDGLLDTGLLRNGRHPEVCDGKVFWTCGALSFWYAFFWWDRSGDKRGNSSSGLYVRGFGWPEAEQAFTYGCEQFPRIVARQKHPLILQLKDRP